MLQKNKLFTLGLYDALTILGLLLICITPVIFKELQEETVGISRIVSSVLYSLPLCCLIMSIRKKWGFVVVSSIIMLVAIIETLMATMYQNYIIAGNILAIITTTVNEGAGFLSTATHTIPYYIPIFIGYVIAIRYHKKIKQTKAYLLMFGACLMLCIAFLTYQIHIKWQGKHTTYFYVKQNVLCRPPYNFFFQVQGAVTQMRYRTYISDAKNMSFNAHRDTTNYKEIYVLAIGESLRYGNLSLSGYERKTTPNLDTMKNVTLYTDYYSTATLTMFSVPQILTRATPHDFETSYKESSVHKPYKECGFKTFTICCDNLLTYEKHLSHDTDSLYCVKRDSDIAPIIDSLTQKHDKTFFVIQFFGNHGPYKNFRIEDNVYRPNPIYDNTEWDSMDAKKNAYDNTVRFADYNVSNIIKAIDKPETMSAFILISDHGEDLRPESGGHGGTSRPNKEEYHVPFIFWNSTLWKENNKEKHSALIKNKDKSINADNVFYTACDMAGIILGTKYAKPHWSVLSESFTTHKRFLLTPDGSSILELK